MIKMGKKLRIFILESVGPADLLSERSEGKALGNVCKELGYSTATLNVRSWDGFKEACNYISSIEDFSDTDSPPLFLCVHISSHGNEAGLSFGKDHMSWDKIGDAMKPICEINKHDNLFISISACAAGEQKLSDIFRNIATPPEYIFVTNEEDVGWDEALVAWIMLYYHLARSIDRGAIQKLMNAIKTLELSKIKYFRWDMKMKSYRKYSGR